MNQNELELPIHIDNNNNEDKQRDKIYFKLKSLCKCFTCTGIVIFTNYISFCVGVIYFQRDGSLANDYII
jgi:hypothetical protein